MLLYGEFTHDRDTQENDSWNRKSRDGVILRSLFKYCRTDFGLTTTRKFRFDVKLFEERILNFFCVSRVVRGHTRLCLTEDVFVAVYSVSEETEISSLRN